MSVNPADSVVFGTLFGTAPMRAVFDDRALIGRMLEVEGALALVQGRLGIIPADAAAAIAAAARTDCVDLAELGASVRTAGTPVVGLVRALTNAAGPAGRWVHWGATTQDIIDSAVVLQIRAALELLRADLLALIAALARQADANRASVMAGRTFLQHALPISFGLKCAGWMQPLISHVERQDQLSARILRVQFGGAVGTLASLGAHGVAVLEGLAGELGLAAPAAPWHGARDGMAECACWLGLVCGSLGKIATDIALLAQTEVGEVSEPHEPGRGGSSTLPHKRNPIGAVHAIAAVRAAQALVPQMLSAMVLDHERGTGPWQSESLALGQCFLLTAGALVHMLHDGVGLVVDAGRMRANLDLTNGLIMTEAVSMALAPRLGREAAHLAVKAASDMVLRDGISLTQALAAVPAIGGGLSGAEIASLTDPASYLGAANGFIDRVLAAAAALPAGGA